MLLRRLVILALGLVGAAVTAATAAGGLEANHNETLLRDSGGVR